MGAIAKSWLAGTLAVLALAGMAGAQAALPPGRILAEGAPVARVLATLIRGEWATAVLMQAKAQQPRTRAYARVAAADQARNWRRLRETLGGQELSEVPELKQEWQIFRSILRNQSGATADRDYLRGEIEVARRAAAALPALIPSAPRARDLILAVIATERRQALMAERVQRSFAGAGALGLPSEGAAWRGSYLPPR